MMEDIVRFVSYRNGLYQGQLRGNRRHGQGILITDKGQIIVGEFKNDLLNGSAFAFINNNQFAFLQFNRGEVEGSCYFKNQRYSMFSEFSRNKPTGKILLYQTVTAITKVLTYRSPNYQVLESCEEQLQKVIDKQNKKKYNILTIIEYFEKKLLPTKLFQLKSLSNGYLIFKANEQSNPMSLGIVLNANNKLMSYGQFVNDKLHGLGYKLQSNSRLEGLFENGVMSGLGLKHMNSKYSFGQFKNGNLTQAIYFEERTDNSEIQLKELKKMEHIRSLHFVNCYIDKKIIGTNGISEVSMDRQATKDFLYEKSTVKKVNNLGSVYTQRKNVQDFDRYSNNSGFKKRNLQTGSQVGRSSNYFQKR